MPNSNQQQDSVYQIGNNIRSIQQNGVQFPYEYDVFSSAIFGLSMLLALFVIAWFWHFTGKQKQHE